MTHYFVALCYLVNLTLAIVCIFFVIYTIISMEDLRNQHEGPIAVCDSLNQLILPEYGAHFLGTMLFLFSGQLISLCMNMPLIVYHVIRYANRPTMSGPGIYDATRIMKQDELQLVTREGCIKAGYYLLSFFCCLYGLISNLQHEKVSTRRPHAFLRQHKIYKCSYTTDNGGGEHLMRHMRQHSVHHA
ncbi:cornichon protein [Ditylenchus destructor]|nr:cornichon protein [Ditylenchus destructor]